MAKILGMTFTYSMSLEEWVKLGLFDREKRIYEEHLKQGNFDKIIWFTYGSNDDIVGKELWRKGQLDERIEIVPQPKWAKGKLLRYIYSILIPYVHKDMCSSLSIIKSNQMQGARVAAAIGRKYHIPFIFRTGYTFSLFYKRQHENTSNIKKVKAKCWLRIYSKQEQKLYNQSNMAFVSSNEDKQYIIDKYNIDSDKIRILTNYIDCDLFRPRIEFLNRKDRFLYVGRLNQQKNLKNLFIAFKELNVGIDLYGTGEMEEELNNMISETDDIVLKGKVSNDRLANIYNEYRYFILPSFYEGMPKTLLEAMACGCVCFGTDVEGIREVLDGKNGFIIPSTDSYAIKNTIEKVINKEFDILKESAHKAALYIKENHELQRIVCYEGELCTRLK